MKTLLITGGAGFIGSNFVHYCCARYPEYRVIVLDALTYAGQLANLAGLLGASPRVIFRHGDVCDRGIVEELVSVADVVVHFAAESHVARSLADNRIFFETDVMGTHTVANAIVRYQKRIERFVHMSTSEVYGTAVREPMDEDHPLEPTNPYAAAKAGADRLVSAYRRTYGIPAIIVRPFNTYGPHQHIEKVVPAFVTQALLGQPLAVHGTGEAARDWLYVDDHVAALDRVLHGNLEVLAGQVINIGTGIATSVRALADMVLDLTGKAPSLAEHVADRPGQVARHIAGAEKARRLFGWEPTTSLRDGLLRTIAWYARNRDWWEPLRRAHLPVRPATGAEHAAVRRMPRTAAR